MVILKLVICVFSVALTTAVSVPRRPEQVRKTTIQIKGYAPQQDDDYVAISIPAPKGYIVAFEPSGDADRVHHMLLYGCRVPYKESDFWRGAEVCSSPGHILYAWARNAPPLHLPNGVAFAIGPDSDVTFLVLQVHYAHPFIGNVMDYSGITVSYIEEKPQYLAAVYLFVSGTPIAPGDSNYAVNMSCIHSSETTIYPFAFRTHTHGMGRVVSAALKNESGWSVIGKSNPQWPQVFNPVKNDVVVRNGDLMAARCIYDSSKQNSIVQMGSMGHDEMCNFYMMFYRDAEEEDPYPLGAVCANALKADMVNREYPPEALSRLPSHPELEHVAHQSGKPFGITDGGVWQDMHGQHLGQVSGLAFDPSGNLVVFHRCERMWERNSFDENNVLRNKTPIAGNTIWVMKLDGEGKAHTLVATYGKSLFYLPHGLHINDKNEYFTTDVGAQLVTKWKITKDGLQELFSLGTKLNPGQGREHFCLPTAVVTSPSDGAIYISDGYCNNRVVKFAANGKYLTEWGQPYYGTEQSFPVGKGTLGLFALPHDISTNEDGSRLFVADRQNARVQIFNSNGAAIDQISNLPDQKQFSTVYSAHYHGGSVYFVPGDKFEKLRVFRAQASTALLQFAFEPSTHPLNNSHVVRVSPDGRFIYVGELSAGPNGRLLQFVIHSDGVHQMDMKPGSHGSDPVLGGGPSFKSVVILLIFLVVVSVAVVVYNRRKGLFRSGPKHSVLDRAGFKPLRMDYPSSEEDDSDEDDTIISQIKSDARF